MTMRDVRVTRRTATPRIRMGSGDAPDTFTYTAPHNGRVTPRAVPRVTGDDRSTRHRIVIDRETGFVDTVTAGRDGATVTECAEPVSAPNRDDRRAPTRRDANGRHIITGRFDVPTGPARRYAVNPATGARVIVDDNINGGIASPRMVRTVADGDDRLPGVRRAPARAPRGTTSPRATGATTDRLADVRAFASAHGIPLEKLADRRVVAAIRDVMAHRAGVAAYAAK